jgi:hypothetical protein
MYVRHKTCVFLANRPSESRFEKTFARITFGMANIKESVVKKNNFKPFVRLKHRKRLTRVGFKKKFQI